MSRVETFRDTSLRCRLRELRTDIAMSVDDTFPLVHGLADKNIISDQQFKVRHNCESSNIYSIFYLYFCLTYFSLLFICVFFLFVCVYILGHSRKG